MVIMVKGKTNLILQFSLKIILPILELSYEDEEEDLVEE